MKEVSLEISAQPSFLRLFFKDSLVPMTACCQTMPLVGFFLFLAPLPTSHSATLQGPRPYRRRIPHLLAPHPRAFSAPRCSLAARLQAYCILLPALGFAPFCARVPIDCCCQPPLRFPHTPGLRGLTPFEVFPSSAAALRHRIALPSCCSLSALYTLPKKDTSCFEPQLQGFAPPTSPCCVSTLLQLTQSILPWVSCPLQGFPGVCMTRPFLQTARCLTLAPTQTS